MEDVTNGKWHLDKRVSVGHLITTLAMVGAAALWMLRIEGHLDLVNLRDTQTEARIERLEVTQQDRDAEIIRRLERIQDTLAEHERTTNKEHQ